MKYVFSVLSITTVIIGKSRYYHHHNPPRLECCILGDTGLFLLVPKFSIVVINVLIMEIKLVGFIGKY